MGTFIVEGGRKLKGKITPSGNKNEALAVIAAAMLTDEKVILENIPEILDTKIMLEILESLGAEVKQLAKGSYSILAKEIGDCLDNKLTSKIRSSLLFLAPMLARKGFAKMPSSGGDKIGRRRVDTHILAFKKFGAKLEIAADVIISLERAIGSDLILDEASVMATENAIMMAVLAKGRTTIYNAACEPHVQNLCKMLIAMGAKISGIGSNYLIIEGVEKLNGTTHRVLPDHIETGSLIGLAMATRSKLQLENCYNQHLDIILPHFKKIGASYQIMGNDIIVDGTKEAIIEDDLGGKIPIISDQPWPCFPADLTSLMVVAAIFSKGTVIIHEKMFEARLFFTDSLIRMGAKIVLCDPHRVVVTGPNQLRGIEMSSPDIRAGMSLLIASLAAEGQSIIHNVRQIDRGYEAIDQRVNKLGASIKRIQNFAFIE